MTVRLLTDDMKTDFKRKKKKKKEPNSGASISRGTMGIAMFCQWSQIHGKTFAVIASGMAGFAASGYRT